MLGSIFLVLGPRSNFSSCNRVPVLFICLNPGISSCPVPSSSGVGSDQPRAHQETESTLKQGNVRSWTQASFTEVKGRGAENVRNSEAPGARSEGLKRSGNRNQWERPSYGRLRATASSRVWRKQHFHFTLLLLSDLLLVTPIGRRQ